MMITAVNPSLNVLSLAKRMILWRIQPEGKSRFMLGTLGHRFPKTAIDLRQT